MAPSSSPFQVARRYFPLLLLLATGCGDSADDQASNWSTTDGGEEAASDSGADAVVFDSADGSIDGEPDGCPTGTIDCGNGCVNTNNDSENCGGCGTTCDPTEECHAGMCGAPCDDECSFDGESECSGAGVRRCGEYDNTDICFDWGPVEDCPAGEFCDPTTETCREPCGSDCDPFSIILLPDTQYYTNKQANNSSNTYRKQTQWIVDHQQSENIKFVIHLGDITNNNELDQWDVADTAHAILDNASVPYSVAPGNHDYLSSGDFVRGDTHLDEFFGPDRFTGKPWYGGAFRNSNTNNYTFFEVGDRKFMVLSLEYAPRKDALCWAEDVISAHPNHRVIIATHCYQTHGGGYSSGCPDPDYTAVGGNGHTVWDELVSRHSNIFLVVAGHIGDSEYRVKTGNAGNNVHEMLVDYQFEAYCTSSNPSDCRDNCRHGTYTGNGWMRQLVFDPQTNNVHAETFTVEDGNSSVFPGGNPALFCSELYNPPVPGTGGQWYSQDPSSSDHRYDFAYDMNTPVSYLRDDGAKYAFNDRGVNTAGAGDQLAPRVAMTPGGNTVVVWEDDSSTADGAGRFDIKARGFGAGGCETFSDIVVNTTTEGQQQSPSVAVDDQGNFVVVWGDDHDDNGVFQIYARGFAADGSERFPAFTVNSAAQGQQSRPAVAMTSDGRFVVAWEDDPANNGDAQILVRGFAADGNERFADQRVHTDVVGQRIRPSVAIDASGGFVVAWQDDSDGNGSYQIHARGFESDGAERFARKTVNTLAPGQQRNPVVGMAASGTFVVAWEDDPENDGDHQILARGFQANGAAGVAEFRVHGTAGGQHRYPSLSMGVDGAFGLAWQDDGDGNGTHQIRAHTFRADGSEWMGEWTVNRVADGQQLSPGIGLNAAGTVVTAWEDDMDGNGAFQILAAGVDSP